MIKFFLDGDKMNSVYIVNVTPLLNKEVYNYYYRRVGKLRQIKADRLLSDIDKARSVGVGAVLRFAVEDSTSFNFDELELKFTDKGKPFFEGNPFYISLSHSGDYAACAISDTPIGVDIEKDSVLPEKIQKRFAKDILEWTKKEAKGKLTGNGFFDQTEDNFVYTHHTIDSYTITVCADKKTDNFYIYHLPFPC